MTQTPICTDISSKQEQDQHLVYSGLTWEQFKLIQAGFAESNRVRLFYYQLRDRKYAAISRSEIPELADIDLLTRCVLTAKTSRLEAVNIFRKALKGNLNEQI